MSDRFTPDDYRKVVQHLKDNLWSGDGTLPKMLEQAARSEEELQDYKARWALKCDCYKSEITGLLNDKTKLKMEVDTLKKVLEEAFDLIKRFDECMCYTCTKTMECAANNEDGQEFVCRERYDVTEFVKKYIKGEEKKPGDGEAKKEEDDDGMPF